MSDQLTSDDIARLKAFAQQAKNAERLALTAYWRFGIEANSFNASDADIAKEIGRGPQYVNIARKMADVYPRRKEWDDAVDENDLQTVEDFKVKILGWKAKKEYAKKSEQSDPYKDTKSHPVYAYFKKDTATQAEQENVDLNKLVEDMMHDTPFRRWPEIARAAGKRPEDYGW